MNTNITKSLLSIFFVFLGIPASAIAQESDTTECWHPGDMVYLREHNADFVDEKIDYSSIPVITNLRQYPLVKRSYDLICDTVDALAKGLSMDMAAIAEQDFDADDIRDLYGDKVNASNRIKLEKRKSDIEARRVGKIGRAHV